MQYVFPVTPTQVAERETTITLACKAWRGILPVHPACEILPAYDDSKLIKLGRDIKASGGIKIPVIVLVPPDGRLALLDGRSRLDAMVHVGIKSDIKIVDGHVVIDAPGYDIPAPIEIVPDANFNAYAFVLSTNLHRRHLKNSDKRNITKKMVEAQPALSDRAIAKMAGVDHKTVKALRQEINANGEIPHNRDRVETTGREARGRKPGQSSKAAIAKPVDVIPAAQHGDKLPAVPIAVSFKPKPTAAPNGFNAEEVLAHLRLAFTKLNCPVSEPNFKAARKEVGCAIDLLLRHKSLRDAA
jgi:hypothetical protein